MRRMASWNAAPGSRKADRKSTRLNSSHLGISYAVFCLKKKSLDRKFLGLRLTRPSRNHPVCASARHGLGGTKVGCLPCGGLPVFLCGGSGFFFFNLRAPPEFSPFPQRAAVRI